MLFAELRWNFNNMFNNMFAGLHLLRLRILQGLQSYIGQDNNKFGSRTVSYNPPCHSGVGFRRDF